MRTSNEITDFINGIIDNEPRRTSTNNCVTSETESGFEIEVIMPGLVKGNFDVSVSDGNLVVSTKKVDKSDSNKYLYEFTKYWELGPAIDAENITGDYKQGILTVTIPKIESKKPSQISIS